MTQSALDNFQNASGWELGADAEFTVPGDGASVNLDTTSLKSPVILVIFGTGWPACRGLAGRRKIHADQSLTRFAFDLRYPVSSNALKSLISGSDR